MLGYMQVCTSSQTTTPTSHHSVFLQAGCPSCHPTNSVKALKEKRQDGNGVKMLHFVHAENHMLMTTNSILQTLSLQDND